MDRKLSDNLMLSEMLRSESAKRLGVNNTPTQEHVNNMIKLAQNVFQPIRNHFKVPIRISSGYRSAQLNAKIKGASKTSEHSLGMAMDIDMDNTSITNKQVFNYIKDNLIFNQLIWEFGTKDNPSWVHVSFNEKNNKKEILEAFKQGNLTKYRKYAN